MKKLIFLLLIFIVSNVEAMETVSIFYHSDKTLAAHKTIDALARDKGLCFSMLSVDVIEAVKGRCANGLHSKERKNEYLAEQSKFANNLAGHVCRSFNPYFREAIPVLLERNYSHHEHFILYHAIAVGDVTTVNKIVSTTPGIETVCLEGYTPLHFAIINGFPTIVKALWSRTKHTDEADLLVSAVDRGFCNTVRFLLDKGVDVETGSKEHKTPLISALVNFQQQAALTLLSRGAQWDYFVNDSKETSHKSSKTINNYPRRLEKARVF